MAPACRKTCCRSPVRSVRDHQTNGGGLGLALVAKIVGDHGGIVECDVAPRARRFGLLPMAQDGANRKRQVRNGDECRATILVADDDAAIRTVLAIRRSRAPAMRCAHCGNAADAVALGQQGEGDLVITDVVMPDENAFDLLPRIKKMRPELPVIVMSAQNTFMTAIRRPSAAPMNICQSPSTSRN
jgi:CheY-like chemotaxis protein